MARKTTRNRLLDARDALAATQLQITALEARRRDQLLRDTDAAEREAERLDLELERMRRQAARYRDKVELLTVEASLDEQGRRFPQDRAAALTRLTELNRRLEFLMRKPRFDRSAVDDGDISSLRTEIETLTTHIRLLGPAPVSREHDGNGQVASTS
jgi:hypothetical protein